MYAIRSYYASLRPDVAVHLNVSPDHLDRHGDLAGYVAAKRHLFDHPADGSYNFV